MRARHEALHEQGSWSTNDFAAPSCLVHVLENRIQMGAWDGIEPAAVPSLVTDAARELIAARRDITFAALDRHLLPALTAALAPLGYEQTWHSKCGMYHLAPQQATHVPSPLSLPSTAILRPLRDSDAPHVDSRWAYRSDTSLGLIRRMIEAGSAGRGCVGVEEGGTLCGWVLRYLDGPLGMLHVDDYYRRRGYARALIRCAVDALESAGLPCFAYIVDGNVASEWVFVSEGWERVANADWVGFGVRAGVDAELL